MKMAQRSQQTLYFNTSRTDEVQGKLQTALERLREDLPELDLDWDYADLVGCSNCTTSSAPWTTPLGEQLCDECVKEEEILNHYLTTREELIGE
jgi:hypothetical protein